MSDVGYIKMRIAYNVNVNKDLKHLCEKRMFFYTSFGVTN